MNAWTLELCETVKDLQDMAGDRCVLLCEVSVASLNLIRHSIGSQWSCCISGAEEMMRQVADRDLNLSSCNS